MNNKIKCTKCDKLLPSDSEFCPYCGIPLTNNISVKSTNTNKLKKKILIASIAVILAICVMLGGFFGYKNVIIPMQKYNQANDLLKSGDYQEAMALFKELNSYKDSNELFKKSNYKYAIDLYKNKDYDEAFEIFYELKDYKDSKKYLQKEELRWRIIGNEFTLGSFEQDNNTSNGKEPIEWIVLDNALIGDSVYAISKYCLDYRKFNSENFYNGDGDLDIWLRKEFYSSAFTLTEKEQLMPYQICYTETEILPSGAAKGKNPRYDYVGLPDSTHIKTLKKNNISVLTTRTEYAIAQADVPKSEIKDALSTPVGYWLNTSSGYMYMNIVNSESHKIEMNSKNPNEYYAVRPVICIKKK